MKLGIIGFPGGGKTAVFQLLTGADASVARRGSRGDLHVGVARVPDERLGQLAPLFEPERVVMATVEVVDVGGLERGDRQSLDVADLRSADALLHVVRGFPSAGGEAAPDAAREVSALEDELILADLEIVERRLSRLGPALRRKPTELEQREYAVLGRLKGPLEEGASLRTQPMTADEGRLLRGYGLLSLKPILHCLNLAEADVGRREELLAPLAEVAKRPATAIGWVSAVVEAEVAALPAEDQRSFLDALGLPEPGLHRVLRDAYALLGLVSFFTVGEDEVRAWTIPAGATALEAAAAVHSDIARGFIRAEVIGWAELVEARTLAEARRRGVLRLEGKEYRVQDGEICHFRFNVGR
jgi:GTP-binding protein YchF